MAQSVKNLPAMLETWVQSLGWGDPLEKGKATHSSAKSLQSCLTLCDPIDGSPRGPAVPGPPGFSVQGISQSRMLEWVAIPFSRGSPQPRD